MRTIQKSFTNRLFKISINQIELTKRILTFPIFIYLVYSFWTENENHIFQGLFYLIFATICLLSSLENKILKKKITNDFDAWLLGGILFFIFGILELFGF
ncbi:hypothetical protein [Bacillus sp. EAC]|uniref:hypothetical protein n=1 Tax=Bacillus sp. EAC TaxID=1978338 RepID=UPI000B444D45|nr:hypothetical protein [Bacillus sp. EAC]